MTQIRPDSKVYIMTYLRSNYQQVIIHPEDRGLFGFLLSDGCYRYTCAPMGSVNSGHHFVSEIMRLVQDLDMVMEVDDGLMQAPTDKSLFTKFEALLECCQLHNIKLARRKLQYRSVVIFARYEIGSNQAYRPKRKKVEALEAIEPQKTVKELHSYLGVINCFRNFMPDLTQQLTGTRELLNKGVQWNWTPAIQEEFTSVKEILAHIGYSTLRGLLRPRNRAMPHTMLQDRQG